jgi:hypothetical protein
VLSDVWKAFSKWLWFLICLRLICSGDWLPGVRSGSIAFVLTAATAEHRASASEELAAQAASMKHAVDLLNALVGSAKGRAI